MKRIALVGTPNSGKTALFNRMTQSNQRVANYSGVTTESAEADFLFLTGEKGTLIDLPGAYSLRPYTDEEKFLSELLKTGNFDGLCIVLDATQLERGVRFAIEVLSVTNAPAVIALNMTDLAESRGFGIDVKALESALGVPVVPTIAVKKTGFAQILEKLAILLKSTQKRLDFTSAIVQGSNAILENYKLADAIVKKVITKPGRPDHRSERIDHFVLHPVWGTLILFLVLGTTFQLMFNLAEYPMGWIESLFSFLSASVNGLTNIPDSVKSFLVDGIIAGVGGTLVFLPQILILFSLILFLEDFGFMSRAVFLLDHSMGKLGLHGRAFLPLLSSYACAIPGIMATKTIESRVDRIATVMMIPLTTCSARVPVYTLLISAFIPNTEVWGMVKLQGLVMLGLYVLGTVFCLGVGIILKKFFLKGERPPLLMELPSYKWPSFQSLFKGLFYRAKVFITRVGTIILALTCLIWFSVSYPKAPEGVSHPIEYSYAAKMGHAIEPLLSPIGFDWKIGMALIPAFAAREVMVSALSTAYAVDSNDANDSAEEKLTTLIKNEWTLATAISLMVWFIFAPQCISTLAVVRRELQSTKWAVVMTLYLFILAYAMSWLAYRLTQSLS